MKHHIIAFFAFLFLTLSPWSSVRATTGDLFPYPVPPDTLMALQPRCDFLINRFWDRCNFDQAFRNPDKLNIAFRDFVFIMPHASADTVHAAVNRLLEKNIKSPDRILTLATLAENWLYSDTAAVFSEEAYLPFAKAVSENKKISKADKARFQNQVSVIESSAMGATVPALTFIRPDGTKGSLADVTEGSVLLFINDPDCDDCNLARVRLSADYNTNQLIEKGQLKVVSIYPNEPDAEWIAAASSYPSTWVVGAMPDADKYFDFRTTPVLLFLNSAHKVLLKNAPIDHYLNAFRVANMRQHQ